MGKMMKKTILYLLAFCLLAGTFGVTAAAAGTGAVLCLADRFFAFDRENLIVPIWII